MKKKIIASLVFVLTLAADILTKTLIDSSLVEGERIYIVGTYVQLTKIYNRGGVFGIGQGHQMVFMLLSIAFLIVLVLFYLYEKDKNLLFTLAMSLIFAGALGNILDRLIQRPGVVDFIYMGVEKVFMWPAYNLADMAIVCGAIMLGFVFFKQEQKASLKTSR